MARFKNGSWRWSASKTQKQEFAAKMREIEAFCDEHGIKQSVNGDSYYFTIGSVNYRVSNHSVEASDRAAFDPLTHEQRRELYHGGRKEGWRYIHASKTRIMEIYSDLEAGYQLDGRGNRIGG